jgi:hypothetical protein
MENHMNLLFFSWLSGLNIVVGIAMMCLLVSGPTKDWPSLKKIGFATIAAGLIGQAFFVFTGTSLNAPFWEQFWILKDLGAAIFTISLINTWINQSKS